MKRILLIDADDCAERRACCLLQNAGHTVTTADRFEDIEGQIREARFDLVIAEKKLAMAAGIARQVTDEMEK